MPTQTTVLDPGTTAEPSELIELEKGDVVTVGIFAETDVRLPIGEFFSVVMVTPGVGNYVGQLSDHKRQQQLYGPGSYRVNRPALDGVSFGVFKVV